MFLLFSNFPWAPLCLRPLNPVPLQPQSVGPGHMRIGQHINVYEGRIRFFV